MNAAPWMRLNLSKAGRGVSWPALAASAVNEAASTRDCDLLRAIAEGDTAALGAFYDLHATTLFGLAYRIVNDAKEAEDVIQDVLLQVWNKGSSYDASQGRPLAWVLTLARHKAIDRLRSTQRRRAHFVEDEEGVQEFPTSAPSAPESAGASEEGERLRHALASLPDPQRRAIELAFFDGMTQTEVAAALNEPLGTVKARIRRGMLKLRDELEQRA